MAKAEKEVDVEVDQFDYKLDGIEIRPDFIYMRLHIGFPKNGDSCLPSLTQWLDLIVVICRTNAEFGAHQTAPASAGFCR